ncbi:hypothetical protein BCR43DRAFT_48533 [Syncephalastrum racemosum]|uniref:Uncharacterized protein n=1 Tax=Syncephalastrum racemosum TaxID=13706 RepID=A0A1X2HUY9_SYNRA|nr:hypothetical protein BCR43DRAFT_48533 [Syncephalastrum racemosum]
MRSCTRCLHIRQCGRILGRWPHGSSTLSNTSCPRYAKVFRGRKYGQNHSLAQMYVGSARQRPVFTQSVFPYPGARGHDAKRKTYRYRAGLPAAYCGIIIQLFMST